MVIDPATGAVEVGQILSLTATYYDETNQPQPATITWASADPLVASVDASGVLTGNQPGQVEVTATAEGITSAPALFTVVNDPNAVARVEVDPDTLLMVVGETQQVAAQYFKLNGDAVVPGTVTWESADATIASVNQTGQVVGLDRGVTRVWVTADGTSSPAVEVMVVGTTRTGRFSASTSAYTIEGEATLERLSGGNLRLKFSDDFMSSNGPNLHVYLSNRPTVDNGSLDLGALKQTSGSQTYSVPAGVRLIDFDHVVIHCVPFNVSFGAAKLSE